MIRAIPVAVILLLGLPIASPALAQGCPEAIGKLRAALQSAPLPEVVRVYRTEVEPACLGTQAAAAARGVALRHVQDAASRPAGAERLTLLRAALQISAEPWQLHEALGDALQNTGEFDAAATHYQLSMNALRDLAPGLAEPPRIKIEQVVAKAHQARLLASAPVPLPRTRDGSLGGLALRTLRGFEVEASPQPIHFITDSDQPAPEGLAAIAQLAEQLREQGNPAISLVGHTDARGSEAHNDVLSLRRAARVADILRRQYQYEVTIRVEGRGKRQPLRIVPVEGKVYTQAERWQLDRRVELVP